MVEINPKYRFCLGQLKFHGDPTRMGGFYPDNQVIKYEAKWFALEWVGQRKGTRFPPRYIVFIILNMIIYIYILFQNRNT